MTRDQCQGRFHDGQRCPYAARHTHKVGEQRLKLCGTHLRVLLKRERLGTEAEKLAAWAGG